MDEFPECDSFNHLRAFQMHALKYCKLNDITYEILQKIKDVSNGGSAWISQFKSKPERAPIQVVIFLLPSPIDTSEYNVKMRFFKDLSKHKTQTRELLNYSKLSSNKNETSLSIVTVWKYKEAPFFSHIDSMDNYLNKILEISPTQIIDTIPIISEKFAMHTTCNFLFDMAKIFNIAREHHMIHGELNPNNILVYDMNNTMRSRHNRFYLRASDVIFKSIESLKEPRGDHLWVCNIQYF